MTDRPVVFTHIPKTAGTSLHHAVFAPHFSHSETCQPNGIRSLLMNRSPFRYMHGHMPYGCHRFAPSAGHPLYFVVLRDPVERALSHYYNILHPRGDKRVPDHPDYNLARTHDLEDFYQNPRFRNLQTRMTAGILASRIGEVVDLESLGIGQLVLRQAKKNLRTAYTEVGLTERFDESAQRFASRLNVAYEPDAQKRKRVPNRPTREDLSERERDAVENAHGLDCKLYRFAVQLFESRDSACISE